MYCGSVEHQTLRALARLAAVCVAAIGIGCGSDEEASSQRAFCRPGQHVIGADGFETAELCDCTVPMRNACLVTTRNTAYTCEKDGRWATPSDEGACANAMGACRDPLPSLEDCFATYRSCVVRQNGNVCGY